jgi:hypothetical protein
VSSLDVQEVDEAMIFGEMVAQLGVALASLVSYAGTDSISNQERVKHEWYRLGMRFHRWYEGGGNHGSQGR